MENALAAEPQNFTQNCDQKAEKRRVAAQQLQRKSALVLTGEHVDHAADNQNIGKKHAIMARNIVTQSQQNRREGNNKDQQSAVRCLLQLVKRVHAIALRLSGLMLWMTNPCWSSAAEELEKGTDRDVLKWDSTEKGSKGEQHLVRAKGKRTHQRFRESKCVNITRVFRPFLGFR